MAGNADSQPDRTEPGARTRGARYAGLALTACLLLGLAATGPEARADENDPLGPPPAGVPRLPVLPSDDAARPPAPPAPPVAAPKAGSGGASSATGTAPVAGGESAAVASDQGPARRIMRLTLKQAVQMGMQRNLALQATQYDTAIAREQHTRADASFDYLLTAGFDISRAESISNSNISFMGTSFTDTGTTGQDGVGFYSGVQRRLRRGGSVSFLYRADRFDSESRLLRINPGWSQTVTFEASQPLLRGAGDVALADIRRAQNGIAAARAGFDTAIEGLLLQIVQAYWQQAFAEENLQSRRKSEEVAGELLADAQSRLDAELGTPLEVAEARAGVERFRSERLAAENQLGAARDALLSRILPFQPDRLEGVDIVLEDAGQPLPSQAPDAGALPGLVRLALRGRPELRGNQADIANRGLDVVVAADQIKPQLDLIASLGTQGLDDGYGGSLGDMAGAEAVNASIGIQFTMFVGRRAAKAQWRAAHWARRQAVLRMREQQNQIVVEVRAAVRDLGTALAQVSAAEAELSAGTEAVEGERDKQRQGKSTPFRVLQKEQDLADARTRLARARADVHIAQAALARAMGTLRQRLGVQVPGYAPGR